MKAEHKKINGSIEVIRYFLTFVVAALHYWGNVYNDASFFEGGYIAVDAFFMISGYFLAVSYQKRSDNPWRFTFRKWKSVFWPCALSILLCIVLMSTSSLTKIPTRLISAIPDFLGLQMTGFFTPTVNGILWYVSSMLIAGFFVSVFYQSNQKRFVNCIAPAVILVGYAIVYHYQGNLDGISVNPNFFIPLGNLRGLAGMSVGVLLFHFTQYMESVEKTKHYKLFLSLAELFAFTLLCACIVAMGHTKWDFFALIAIPVVLFAAISGQTLWSSMFDKAGNKLILWGGGGKSFTLIAYVFSACVYQILTKLTGIENLNKYLSLCIYLVVWILFSYGVTKLMNIWENYLKRLKKGKELEDGTKI